MNTIWSDRDGVYDSLLDAEGVSGWLAGVSHRLPDWGPEAAGLELASWDVSLVRSLRDSLRRLAAVVAEDERPIAELFAGDVGSAVEVVNKVAARAPAWSQLEWADAEAPRRVPQTRRRAFDAALAAIAEESVALFAGPWRDSLVACAAPGCVLYFVRDQARREWCSPSCGNRARVARHYARNR